MLDGFIVISWLIAVLGVFVVANPYLFELGSFMVLIGFVSIGFFSILSLGLDVYSWWERRDEEDT